MPKILRPADLVEMGIYPTEQAAATARHKGTGPEFTKASGRVLYLEEDVISWLRSGRMTRTDQAAPDIHRTYA